MSDDGRKARLKLRNLSMPNTFVFANNVSVSGEIDVDLTWHAVGDFVSVGNGTSVDPDDPTAMRGEFAEATCEGRGAGAHTGFTFHTGPLDATGFYADMGHERNGAFL